MASFPISIFRRTTWPLIGVVHLPALPGSPFHSMTFGEIRDWVAADAAALASAGFDGIIVENFGDNPFFPEAVEPHVIAAMTQLASLVQSVCRSVRPEAPPALGINVLRNDARAAMGIAAVVGAQFIRVNVHVGAMVTDQGILEGKAFQTLRYRKSLGAEVAIFADVFVKHAFPFCNATLSSVARDTFFRGGVDALIVSGGGTGEPAADEDIACVRNAVPAAPLFLGSGLRMKNLGRAMDVCHGAIVGTALKYDGDVHRPVDPARARAFVEARDELKENADGGT